jgi:hypothetical protein
LTVAIKLILVALVIIALLIKSQNKITTLSEKKTLPSFRIADLKENEIRIYFGDRIKNFQSNFLENSNRIKIIQFDLDKAKIQVDYDSKTQQAIYMSYSFEQEPVEQQFALQIIGIKGELSANPFTSSPSLSSWQDIDQIKPYYHLTIFYTPDKKVRKATLAKKEAEGKSAQEIYTGETATQEIDEDQNPELTQPASDSAQLNK